VIMATAETHYTLPLPSFDKPVKLLIVVAPYYKDIADNLVAAYWSSQYRAAIPLFLLIAVILWRPQGLLGRAEERTV